MGQLIEQHRVGSFWNVTVIHWQDRAVILGHETLTDRLVRVRLLTHDHGWVAGSLRLGDGARREVQPGNRALVTWQARLAEHLGLLTVEVERVAIAALLDDPLALAALQSVIAVINTTLPEREPVPGLFTGLELLLDHLGDIDVWPWLMVRWEMELLRVLGFGLDLSRCAATGVTDNDQLAYVSPRTGRAVSLSGGEAYADRLLPLPGFLIGRPAATPSPSMASEVMDGLRLTGYFLEHHALAAMNRPLPRSRFALIALLGAEMDQSLPSAPQQKPDPLA